jgi:hypothetical protein
LQFVLQRGENLRGDVDLHGMEGEFGAHNQQSYMIPLPEGKASPTMLCEQPFGGSHGVMEYWNPTTPTFRSWLTMKGARIPENRPQ